MDKEASNRTSDTNNDSKVDGLGSLQLLEDEVKVLTLYDRMEKLQIEKALLKGQLSPKPATADTMTVDTDDEDFERVKEGLLQSRAAYEVKKEIVEAVMMASPILKAVHNGVIASPIEKYTTSAGYLPFASDSRSNPLTQARDLLPFIKLRDEIAVDLAKQSSEMQLTVSESTKVRAETLRASRRNIELTSELLALAEQVRQTETGQEDAPGTRGQMEDLRGKLKASRQAWKAIKGVAGAIVAGSGVDWASDTELRYVVLDDEG